ncbi:unnamed protein product (macronuclear) [Paramecium tetraurelia]|uniref:Uncharacterized protein n=1 Tax=Paramecium tetraurelia TaxID=5888 RepID=A0C4S7_PARTE|nr:uncharacterized protein GSPATT00006293001 [Paramecium tetraurelia]CAK65794.1 unnamed protein product [Paramecium tetraurelia]|eukprot:XP_001433191.1 hypothetical protein (macronuclear) [Paramecium tetraurelia strain d4-2]
MNNNSLILEYHLYDTIQLLKNNKYKKFIKQSRKLVCNPYLVNDTFFIQLNIQLIRRLLHCQLKVVQKYFVNFSSKQQTILDVLINCMELCQNYQILINKYETSFDDKEIQEKQISRKLKFLNEPNKLTLKQFANQYDKLEPDNKSAIWIKYQWQQLFCYFQKTLLFNYQYCKMSMLKEASLFLFKLYKLKPISTYQSQFLYFQALTLKNTAQFELSNTTNNEVLDLGFSMLLNSLREYHKPKSNLLTFQKQLVQITTTLLINLDIQSKSQEINDNHLDCIQSLNLANFLASQILKPLKKKTDLVEYIASEFEFANEKFEQILLEDQDLTKFTQFLYGYNANYKQSSKNSGNVKLQEMIKIKLQQHKSTQFQKGFQTVNSNQCIYASNSQDKLTMQDYLPIKMKSYHHKDSTAFSNPYSQTSINHTIQVNNLIRESPSTQRDRRNQNGHPGSFLSLNNFSSVKLNQEKPKKRQVSVKCKRANTNSDHKNSYLSQLINLRQKSSLTIRDEISELEKNHQKLVNKLNNQQKSTKVSTIDEFFNKKIEAIAFEECLTLDQIKDTAKKIIQTEWEIHKEMPVTKSLMKSISVSEIQVEQQQAAYNKLQEYREMQNQDYYNTMKDKAQDQMDQTKEVKKLKINQQRFTMKHKKSQQSLFNSQQIKSLVINDTKIQEQFNQQLIQQQNSAEQRIEIKVSPRLARKNNSMLYNSNLDSENQEKGFSLVKGQLIDLMLKNLEYRDELNTQERDLKQFVLPRQFRTKAISPQGGELSLKSQNMSDFKSFAYSTNSTQITSQNMENRLHKTFANQKQ